MMDPRLVAMMQMMQKPRRFDDGGEVIDLGSFDDLANVDLGNIDFSNIFGDISDAELGKLLGGDTQNYSDTVDLGEMLAPKYEDTDRDISGLAQTPEQIEDTFDSLSGIEGPIELPEDVEKQFDPLRALYRGEEFSDTEPGSSGGTEGSQRTGGAGSLGSYKGASYTPGGATIDNQGRVVLPDGTRVTPGGTVTRPDGTVVKPDGTVVRPGTGGGTGSQSNMSWLLPLLLMMMAMNRNQGQGSQAVIPKLTASREQLPYQQVQQAPGYRPGQGGVRYLSDVQYKPMADGGIADLTPLAAGGGTRGLLHGAGDGVSDSIPATIGGTQPARLARGEFVVDARTVSELGNGSTEAGAERLYEMMDRVHNARKKAKRGQDTNATKYLPA